MIAGKGSVNNESTITARVARVSGMPEDTVFRSFSTCLLYLQAPLSAHKKTECRSTLLCLSSVGHDRQPEFVSGSLIDLLLLKQLLVEVLKPDHFCRPFFRSLCTLHENSPFWAFWYNIYSQVLSFQFSTQVNFYAQDPLVSIRNERVLYPW